MSAASVLAYGSDDPASAIETFSLVVPPDKLQKPRAVRRRFVRRRNRGLRPTDPVELKTTRWFVGKKREAFTHPKYGCTKLVFAPDLDGTLVTDVKRHCSKPAPNRRRAFTPAIEAESPHGVLDSIEVGAATTQVDEGGELVESDIVLEALSNTPPALAVVFVPLEQETAVEREDEPDSDVLSLIFDDDVPEKWDCCALPECIHSTRAADAPIYA